MKKNFLTSEDIAEIEFQLEFYTDRRCEAIAYTPISADIAIFSHGDSNAVDFIASIVLDKDEISFLHLYEIHGTKTMSLENKIHRALKDAII